MTRRIDHIVHVVRDLDAARATYERLGFQVGPENAHPWGTKNRLVLLPESYIELLSIPDPEKLPEVPAGTYSFGDFNRRFLRSCGEGLSALALRANDPQAEKAAFDQAGFGGFAILDFARRGKQPGGDEAEVAFSLAFANDPISKHVGFFSCLQKTPERIWFPEWQRHKNGATAIAEAVFVADNPTDHHIFMETFTGARDLRATSLGLQIKTPLGEILIYDPRAFADVFGVPAPKDQGLRLGALVFQADNLAAVRKLLKSHGLVTRDIHGRIVTGAAGAVIAFEVA